jgi:hypothetical protein
MSRRTPCLEPLEERAVPAVLTRLVVDFTPDPAAPAQALGFTPRNFSEAFGPTNSLNVVPRFLDFDRDGSLTPADVRLAADAILARLRDYFAPFAGRRVAVEGVDLEANTNAGLALQRRGRRSPREQVFVLFMGGAEFNPRVLGRSPQAAVGFNYEGFGRVFFDSVVELFLTGNPSGSPERFASFAASVAAHEFGHMLGLGHPVFTEQDRDSVMNSNRARFGVGDGFINRGYLAVLFRTRPGQRRLVGTQNPFQELLRSFRGQPDQASTDLEARDLLFSEGHQPGGGCGCPFCR